MWSRDGVVHVQSNDPSEDGGDPCNHLDDLGADRQRESASPVGGGGWLPRAPGGGWGGSRELWAEEQGAPPCSDMEDNLQRNTENAHSNPNLWEKEGGIFHQLKGKWKKAQKIGKRWRNA